LRLLGVVDGLSEDVDGGADLGDEVVGPFGGVVDGLLAAVWLPLMVLWTSRARVACSTAFWMQVQLAPVESSSRQVTQRDH
jgi:hypothetical protein